MSIMKMVNSIPNKPYAIEFVNSILNDLIGRKKSLSVNVILELASLSRYP
jgi:hypothetical protein